MTNFDIDYNRLPDKSNIPIISMESVESIKNTNKKQKFSNIIDSFKYESTQKFKNKFFEGLKMQIPIKVNYFNKNNKNKTDFKICLKKDTPLFIDEDTKFSGNLINLLF